jgi:dienelactone hydrolase
MIPIARRLARAGGKDLAVFRLLNSTRGWDTTHTPVADAAWALGAMQQQFGDVPVGLVGHSLGGRAALLAGGDERVRSVVALAPWVYRDDRPELAGRRVLVVHGTADRVADPERSAALVRRLPGTVEAGYISIEGGRHAMLGHHQQYDGYAAAFTVAVLLPARGVRVPEPVRRILDGAPLVTV